MIPDRSLASREELAQVKDWIRQRVSVGTARRAARNRMLVYAGAVAAAAIAVALFWASPS